MTKTVKLSDQTEVLIRPMTGDDFEKSLAFFRALPEEDRETLRRDVTKTEVLQERMREIEAGKVKRLVALVDDQIVADGTVELSGHGWEEHMAELRLIIARTYRRKGLGTLMARELYGLAASEKVEELLVRMMRPQEAARSIFRRLGFHEEIVLPKFVKDRRGKKRDLILMRCDLEGLWRQLETLHIASDYERSRASLM